jgi:D-aminoacyl-tRNA deacylase
MRAVVQRVTKGSVSVEGSITGRIGRGLVVLLGVAHEDTEKDVSYMAEKIINLRIFDDECGKMNISLLDIKGEMLIVSQFTLYGDCRKGKRPGYDRAARPEYAEKLYEAFVQNCKNYGIKVETGVFRAMMSVEIHNDGPVTLLIDSRKEF